MSNQIAHHLVFRKIIDYTSAIGRTFAKSRKDSTGHIIPRIGAFCIMV
jgi:hypothetical protein